ncbi:MAG: holo-ACP synthase [Hydrogenothermaceae bacterium]|nr:holo-ACP synthase [Hydrogenothermaceae bacterium]
MKIFTGIDIVKNSRIEKAYKKFGDRFLKKVYTDAEIEYCKSKTDFISCISARFAAKEATIKAFYKAKGIVLHFKDIEILGKSGEPAVIFLHTYRELLSDCFVDISLSHEEDFSIASVFVILY